ncbi:hypothetical protein [Zooshikella harenae]|uniref:Uncharacterized protein n=1 Tax=Zooshikella harenae TaxID=2827238 RepID=A0ABS5ZHY8_9GAMM|nr:hypothetical protein [Zooshikella harenae]MBU2712617.1 hypothetical protein [Zooshikella harenae]
MNAEELIIQQTNSMNEAYNELLALSGSILTEATTENLLKIYNLLLKSIEQQNQINQAILSEIKALKTTSAT